MSKIDERARHFGRGDAHGDWLFAADVACCVKHGTAGRPAANRSTQNDFEKVSASEFARKASTGPARVLRYLTAWDNAANDNLVPSSLTLTPNDEPALPAADQWTRYYPPVSMSKLNEQRQEAVRQQATDDGTSPATVARVLEIPTAVASAIKADPKLANVAETALAQRAQADLGVPSRTAKRSAGEVMWSAVSALLKMRRQADAFVRGLQSGDVASLNDNERDVCREYIRRMRVALDLAESLVEHGGVSDESIAEFIGTQQ